MSKQLPTLGILAAIAALPFASTDAAAQAACGDRTTVLADLEQRYHEQRGAAGITQTGGLLEVTVAPSGSWTILLTLPGQPACVVAAGEQWQFMQSVGAVGISAPGQTSRTLGLR